jgi:uncharacterized protein YgiM (DUF1202 family)
MKDVKINRYSNKKIFILLRAGCIIGMAIMLSLLSSCSSSLIAAIDTSDGNVVLEETDANPILTLTPEPLAVPIPIVSKPKVSIIGQVVCNAEDETNVYLNATDASRIISNLNAGDRADLISYDDSWACISVGEPPFISGFVNLKDIEIKDSRICE